MSEPRHTERAEALRRFKPYPVCKDSGVEWLGKIPEHWEVKRLKDVVPETTVGIVVTPSKYYVDEGVPCLRSLNIAQGTVKMTDLVFISPSANELHRKSKIFEGDVLVVRTGKAGTAVVVPAELDGANCIDLLIIRRSKLADSRFLYHFINSLAASGQVEARSVGAIQDHYNTGTLAELWLPGMSVPEQRAIAAFLDRETARIDALVAKKEQLIELLHEKRIALITRAVTKGFAPNVPMKDSGVEWLREIPAHWGTKRVKNLSKFVTSGSRGWAEYYRGDGSLFIRIGNLRSDSIDLDLSDVQHVDPPQGVEGERTRVRSGDVLISITALIGAVGVVPEGTSDAFVNQHLALVRLSNKEVGARWLAYCVHSRVGQEQLHAELYGGTKDGLGLNDIRSLVALVPPPEEQQRIIGILDRAGHEGAMLVAKVRTAIDRLKELRAALISAAVTGKIDVREVGAA